MLRFLSTIAFLTVFALPSVDAAQVPLVFRDQDREPAMIGADANESIVFASVRDLANTFNLKTDWYGDRQKFVVTVGTVRARFTAWSPVVFMDDIPYNLPHPAILRGGTLLVPAEQLATLLNPIIPGNLSWDPGGNEFRLSEQHFNVFPGTIEERENGTLMTVRLPGSLQIEEDMSPPNWLHLTIIGGHIDAQAFRNQRLGGAIQQVLAYQYQNSARISLRIESGYTYDSMRGTDTGWFMLLFRKEMPIPPPLSQIGELIDIDRAQWSINSIIIDPGHGGRDPGAVGLDGLYEKDVVLAIAQRLRRRIEQELDGVEVFMTRESDEFVSLRERGRIATKNNGKLFISIHANTNPDPRLSGVETYFLSEAKTEEARQVARFENAAIRFEHDAGADTDPSEYEWYEWDDVGEILSSMTSDWYLTESQSLAKLVQDELVRTLAARDLGVRQAEFYVMKGTLASMPSILIEVGYLSNPAEARRLQQASYQRRAADAIFRAVQEFKLRYEQ